MSDTYVKKYDVGQIKLDLPHANYIHELPLLSFGDILHTVNLSLVFNYANKENNLFSLFPGYKLNLQKRFVLNDTNNTHSFYDENGKCIFLEKINDDLYAFQDDSQRILRRTTSTNSLPPIPGSDIQMEDGIEAIVNYFVEYPDGSKEKYSESGYLMAVYDKYINTPFLTYSYYSDGRLSSIIYNNNKKIIFTYSDDSEITITYKVGSESICTTTINASDNDSSVLVDHYSGARYSISLLNNTYEVLSGDQNLEFATNFSKKWICTKDNNGLTIEKVVGNETVDTNEYCFYNLSETTGKYNIIDVVDKYGKITRMQLEDDKIAYSYEYDSSFIDNETNELLTYTGTVFSHNNNEIIGYQTEFDGMAMEYGGFNSWKRSIGGNQRASGCFILSGWVNVVGVESFNIKITKSSIPESEYVVYHEIPVLKNQTWQYFSFGFEVNNPNELTVSSDLSHSQLYMRDLRLTFQSGTILGYDRIDSLMKEENVFIVENDQGENVEALPVKECVFYIGDSKINGKVTAEDILKYKINQANGEHTNEIYYNNGKNIILNSNNLTMKYTKDYSTHTVPITKVAVGKKCYKLGETNITKTNFYASGNTSKLMTKSYKDDICYKTDIYSEFLDLISSKVDNITTTYVRNSKGLIYSQTISAEGTSETITASAVYSNDCTKIISTTDEFGVTTTYETDDTWGLIIKVTVGENNTVINTYDTNALAIIKKTFANGENARNNSLGYSNGRLSSLACGLLDYGFVYSGRHELQSIIKDGQTIKTQNVTENEEGSTVNVQYPSSHLETQTFDKYGRLTSIDGALNNTYDIAPTYNSSTNEYTIASKDNIRGKLASTEDLTGSRFLRRTTKYAYDKNHLSRVGTFITDNAIKEEIFTYDDAGRIIADECNYDKLGNKSVSSEIAYVTSQDSPVADDRVSNFKYKVNGVVKAQTENTYNPFKRISSKQYWINSSKYGQIYTFSGSRISKILDTFYDSSVTRPIGDISYEYDSIGRISSINDNDYITNYTYDEYGQLIKEESVDKVIEYVYNGIGDIVNVKKNGTDTEFTYSTQNPDRLTRYGLSDISYNLSGYPTVYGSKHFDWSKGKLVKYYDEEDPTGSTSSESTEFTYNGFGQRTSKEYTYNPGADYSGDFTTGKETKYEYDHSGRLIREVTTEYFTESASETREFIFLYDENRMIGFMYTRNGATPQAYYYQRNLQGDIVRIYNTSGAKVVEYSYDAWGNCTIKSTTTNYPLANANPIRYRGYYYDEDTNLYYLNSRYYSPEWRRFISPADASTLDPHTVNGLNLYVYASNNPIGVVYSGSNVSRTVDAAMTNSVGLSIKLIGSVSSGGNNSLIKRNMPSVPEWIKTTSSIADSITSSIGPIRTAIYAFTNTDLFDLMRLDGINELPGAFSTTIHRIGIGLTIFNAGIVGYEKYASGSSNISAFLGAGINAGIGGFSIYTSTLAGGATVGLLASTSIPGGWVILLGAGAAYIVGTATNHFFTKMNIGGNTIEGHLNNLLDWLIWWD